jgi:hypothetical protein
MSQLTKQHGHELPPAGETPRMALGFVLAHRGLLQFSFRCGKSSANFAQVANPDLDGADCHVANQVSATESDVRLVALEPCSPVTAATVCVSGPVDVDRSVSTAGVGESRVGAAEFRTRLELDSNLIE